MSDGIEIFSLETISGDSLLNAYLDVFYAVYPDFDEWFMRKVVPNLGVTREIFLAKIGKDIAGICIIKNCEQEKKICSLHVFEPYRGQGVGTALVKHALDVLKDDYPLVTVPEESLTQYKPFFRKFKFQLKDSYDGYYRLGKKEYAFNGFLKPKKLVAKNRKVSHTCGVDPAGPESFCSRFPQFPHTCGVCGVDT